MPNLTIRNLEEIRKDNPKLAEALDDIIKGVSDNTQPPTAPPQVSALQVTASGGIFDIAVTDNNPVYRGVNYFVEYSSQPSFAQPHVIDLGASRNYRATFGNQTLYFRAYSQYPSSPPSAPVYYGTATKPNAVLGGGATLGPSPLPSQGSGTAPTNGTDGGAGFGKQPYRGGVGGRGPTTA
jgi:hypothetical protein